MAKKLGRPSEYDYALCVEICNKVQEGMNVKAVLKSKDVYPDFTTWCRWKRANDELRNLYVNSREDKTEAFEEEMDEIMADLKSGKIEPSAANVIIQTLKWKMSKFYPKMFGDSTKLEHSTPEGVSSISITLDEAPKKSD